MLSSSVALAFCLVAQKPNIVFILADDLGYGETGFTGSKLIETPNIDKLAASGMVLTQSYASAGNCAPSRACLLSGMYSPRHEVYAVGSTNRGPKAEMRLTPVPNKSGLNASVVTLAEALKSEGYATGIFGKWHLDGPEGAKPEEQGFDRVYDMEGDPNKAGSDLEDPKHMFSIEREAEKWIKSQKKGPFFAYVAHHAPHATVEARKATVAKFKSKYPEAPRRQVMYAACVSDLDTSVGKLMETLEAEGLRQNTIVVFTSDNGGTTLSQEPLRGSKGGYYEGGIRVPCAVSWPGVVKPNSFAPTTNVNVDFYPTFVEIAGGKPGGQLDGHSLVSTLKGRTDVKPNSQFWHFPGYLDTPVARGRDKIFRTRPVTVMRKGNWKLVLNHEEWLLDDKKKALELYDLSSDPGEHQDLADQNVAKRDELSAELLAWIERTGAKFASPKG